jgi:[ribosomal protein S5]-alanine N-acetyltransferase
MPIQIDLQTRRLRLRRASAADGLVLHELWNKPEARRYLFDNSPVEMSAADDLLNSCLSLAGAGLGLWLSVEKESGRVIGCAGLLPVLSAAEYEPRLLGMIEPLVVLDPLYWGRGFASESLDAMLGYAFESLGANVVGAVNDIPNIASSRMLKRVGFYELSEVSGPRYTMQTYVLRGERWRGLGRG